MYVQTYNENYAFEIIEAGAQTEKSAVETEDTQESTFMKSYGGDQNAMVKYQSTDGGYTFTFQSLEKPA